MKEKPKQPRTPPQMHDTIRHAILLALEQEVRSAKDLSALVRIPEKDVYGHLDHLRRSLAANNRHLIVTPAECRKCGFEFSKRDRLTKPGKCPRCKGESIHEPLFRIEDGR